MQFDNKGENNNIAVSEEKGTSGSNNSIGQDHQIMGRAYIKKVYDSFLTLYIDVDKKQTLSLNKRYKTAIDKIDEEHKHQLQHYFKNLYQIFKFIYKNKNQLSEIEQLEYIDIIKAQLSYDEIQLLYFNTYYYGQDEFKKILDHYKIFNGHENGSPMIIQNFQDDINKIIFLEQHQK